MAPPKASRSSPSKPAQFSSFKNLYLVLYNLVCALLWLVVLSRVVLLVSQGGFESTYAGVGEFAKWTQTIALLEIVHAAAGKSFARQI
jgi:very-long-chain (3R)-3-hydroxyacyl-CoA dehydratase